MDPLQLCVIWYFVFVGSTVLHEAAHAFAGYFFGDHTALHHGLTTLDPIPHIRRSPFGMVVVPLLSFVGAGWMIGWASTPYDPYWAQRYPKQAALMSLAGPAANLLLVIIAGILIHIGIAAKFFYQPDLIGFINVVEAYKNGLPTGLAVLVSVLFSLNVVLLIFNLIPIPPLDGTAIPEFILKGESLIRYRTLVQNPTLQMFGIFIAWTIMNVIIGPVYKLALKALYF